ncbi:hypothetical protein BDW22DRAFT_1429651 [Trametopsis cervina]|nr:hypothetical protein BDW22DRAFT_1429651 [Trametopsis cervina]
MSSSPAAIRMHTKYIAPSERSMPALAMQITELVGSYMVWVGTTDVPAEKVESAPSQGSLLRDWSCAMPPLNAATPPAATNLYRSSSSEISLSMAQRLGETSCRLLARRFQKQIFVSVDIPPSFMTLGDGSKLLVAAEKAVVQALQDIEARG